MGSVLPACCRGECPSLPPPIASRILLHLLGEVPQALLLCHRLADQASGAFQDRGATLLLVVSEFFQPHHDPAPLAAGLGEVLHRLPVPASGSARAALAIVLAGPGVMAHGAGFPGESKKGSASRGQGKRTCSVLAAEVGPGASECVQGHPEGRWGCGCSE